ncbi:MAG: TVP38/TMEM64 family protein [Xenococcaceae cyanobacterium MO_188.B29]|nr:TVP38/TMEM64 family protein [Xenococcaceae cyanobacterium MO_188.B29]
MQSKRSYLSCNQHKKNKDNFIENPRLWLAIALGISLILLTVSPFKVLFEPMFLVEYLRENQCCVIIPFIITYTILTVVGIPGTILTVAGGIVFGLWWGTLWSVIGATLGALGAFWTARYLLRDYIKRKFSKNKLVTRFNQAIADRPMRFVLAVRFAPISPFNVVNFVFGLTPLHWFTYTMATFVGIIPGTLAYTWLGISGIEALAGGDRLPLILAVSLLTFLSILPMCVGRRRKVKN